MTLYIFKPLNRSRLGGEVHPNLIELPRIGQVGLGIALLLDLLQSLFGRTVQLELEDIDVIGRLNDTIDSALALFLFAIDHIDTQEAQQQVESVMEVAFILPFVLLPTHGVGHTGQESGQLVAELFDLSLLECLDSLLYPGGYPLIGSAFIGIATGVGVPYLNTIASIKGGKEAVTTVMPLLSASLYLGQFLSPILVYPLAHILFPSDPWGAYEVGLIISLIYSIQVFSTRHFQCLPPE